MASARPATANSPSRPLARAASSNATRAIRPASAGASPIAVASAPAPTMSAREERRTMALKPGDILDGKYRILGALGKGGMSVVYLAEHVRVRRQVAIKVLLAKEVSASDDAVMRFEREAQAAGRIGSEHIVEVMDIG